MTASSVECQTLIPHRLTIGRPHYWLDTMDNKRNLLRSNREQGFSYIFVIVVHGTILPASCGANTHARQRCLAGTIMWILSEYQGLSAALPAAQRLREAMARRWHIIREQAAKVGSYTVAVFISTMPWIHSHQLPWLWPFLERVLRQSRPSSQYVVVLEM